ncbi:uncharacterized protein DS421_10g305180 [Arachis hypogaea]|nr:uncharacterized protein DS421_10g305180 [Arachis hypogaea]
MMENKDFKELKEEISLNKKLIEDLKGKLVSKEEELRTMNDAREKDAELLKKKENDIERVKNQMIDTTVKMKNLKKGKETEILDAVAKSSEWAINQAKFLVPEQDSSAMDLTKVVFKDMCADDDAAAEEKEGENGADE